MPETESQLLRPPKKANLRGKSIFGDLLSRVVLEPILACDFAFTYESLGSVARKKLVETVVRDARAESTEISALLVALLAVERDEQIARLIATNITVEGGKALLPSCRRQSLLAGDEQWGGVVIVRPLYASFVDVYALAWNSEAGITHALCEPITNATDITRYARILPDGLAFDEAPFAFTIDLVAKVLWNQRKRFGPLPAEFRGFVDLFRE
jgi:hypothetical protein